MIKKINLFELKYIYFQKYVNIFEEKSFRKRQYVKVLKNVFFIFFASLIIKLIIMKYK